MADNEHGKVRRSNGAVYPPIAGPCHLKGQRFEAFTKMVEALRVLDLMGETDAAIALCEAVELLVGSRQFAEDREVVPAALIDRHDAYFADVTFQRFLSDHDERRIDPRPDGGHPDHVR